MFQFLMVQLKEYSELVLVTPGQVSIPYGSIKSIALQVYA